MSILTATLVTVYFLILIELSLRAGPEIDDASRKNQMPRLVAEILWTGLIVAWPVTVPTGWLLRWASGKTEA